MGKNKNTNKRGTTKNQQTSTKEVSIGSATIIAAKIAASATIIVALIGLGNTLISIYAEKYPSSTQVINTDTSFIPETDTPATLAAVEITEVPSEVTPTPTYSLLIIKPTKDDLKIIPIINVGYKDILEPGINTYNPKVSSKRSYLWTYTWCSKHDTTLIENVRDIKFSFFINQTLLSEDNFLIYKDYSIDGWPCQRWTTILSNWDVASPPTFAVVYNISHPTSDGVFTYDIGEYRHELSIRFTE